MLYHVPSRIGPSPEVLASISLPRYSAMLSNGIGPFQTGLFETVTSGGIEKEKKT